MIELQNVLLKDILAKVSEPNAQLGGGSAILIGASLGISLVVKAIEATLKKNIEDREILLSSKTELLEAQREFLRLAVEDGSSYDKVLAARRMPKDTEKEIEEREKNIERAWRNSVDIPFQAVELCVNVIKCTSCVSSILRRDFRYDVVSALRLFEVSILGCLDNALDNSKHSCDDSYRKVCGTKSKFCNDKFQQLRREILDSLERGV
ncbi:cyclodeaminase/cyclohydrolase family protein [bacterium]|nr:cyclodeaminase/cyclohydrolase family protein [bacterium]